MIDEIRTREIFGYNSTDLSIKSSRKIVVVCNDCQKERTVKKYAYRDLCVKCVQKFCYKTESCREQRKLRVLGDKNPFFGKKHSEETKKKISESWRSRELELSSGVAAKNKVISYYKSGAKKKNLEFSLTPNDLDILFSGNCHYCDSPPSTIRKHGIGNGEFTYNGIDRVDNQIGYILENCVSCCGLCNMTKRDLKYESFLDLIKRIHEYRVILFTKGQTDASDSEESGFNKNAQCAGNS